MPHASDGGDTPAPSTCSSSNGTNCAAKHNRGRPQGHGGDGLAGSVPGTGSDEEFPDSVQDSPHPCFISPVSPLKEAGGGGVSPCGETYGMVSEQGIWERTGYIRLQHPQDSDRRFS